MNAPLRPTAVPLYDAAAARAGDAAAVAQGDTWYGLMDRAAGHLARHVVDVGGHGYGLRVAVIAGRGDNGGDGWAVARRLQREYG
ncbi:MAG: NAD(P)H-hydrate epimerase, partial [Nitriliruptoraceae bacterium]